MLGVKLMSLKSLLSSIFRKSKPLNLDSQPKITQLNQDYSWFYQGKYESNDDSLFGANIE